MNKKIETIVNDDTTMLISLKSACSGAESIDILVHETEEAILLLNGEARDLFGAGKHAITPLGENVDVMFFSLTRSVQLKWGTATKILYNDTLLGAPMSLGLSGDIFFSIKNSRKLLTKMIGREKRVDGMDILSFFEGFIQVMIKNELANMLGRGDANIIDIDCKILEVSELLKEKLIPKFDEYGISLDDIFITNLVRPTDNAVFLKYINGGCHGEE